jgi:hypothetical protein
MAACERAAIALRHVREGDAEIAQRHAAILSCEPVAEPADEAAEPHGPAQGQQTDG